ncbi:uncharacterized protein LOC111697812 [Eurytemora carolleeae]|uniref:uncharacterized protein LOC111697812 n=1 Tax=Eurytemora carolleeae TaxID=1294199 RepID=UPI000C76022D|nr:uncharacterized protein LOC111697812 [Eurytemora carolleeae]|eukprot:XP_023323711.1 uncharacterized protein LOC111697812 [Eurytemora affinis]
MESSQSSSQIMQSSQSSSLNASNIQETSSRSRNVSGGNGTVLQGNRFNITNGLKRSSRVQSEENLNKQNTAQDLTVGSAFKILDSALQQYASHQQKQQDQIEYVAKVSSRQTSRKCSLVPGSGCEDVTTVTVSLPPSRNTSRINSRRGSVDIGKRSRRNSLDIFTAEYSVKMAQGNKVDSLQQKTAFHMKVDNKDESDLKLCGRCHLPTHNTATCTEYNNLFCPRCLSWEHWEDSCPIQDQDINCSRCNYIGHLEEVHDVTNVHQRRTCVDHLGWEPFQTWFYEPDFRNWWQVTGCVGVPLYRVYPRKSEWRVTRPKETQKSPGNVGGVSKTDSVDDMIAQFQVLSQRREYKHSESGDSSGRSTPLHLKTFNIEDESGHKAGRKTRTYSETLRSLDEDILAELNVGS